MPDGTSPATIGPGTRVGGFVVESLIGRGGMASVYRATQVRLERPVALKVLSAALAADDEFVRRFRQEGVNAAKLDHPHIVPVYEAGEDGATAFLAMKLIEGRTLRDRLGEDRDLPVAEVLRIVGAVGEALDHAHAQGFVHRDVKPGNVLLAFDDSVYLSDFGLTKARTAAAVTSSGQWVGTVDYMAPEQARGVDVDHRADLYALGCVFFECVTGRRPFTADDPVAVLFAHASRDVPAASAVNPRLPAGLDDVLRRAMAKSPSDRYGSAQEFVGAVRAALRASARIVSCPSCGGKRTLPGDVCAACGSRLARCASCGGTMVATDRFCQHCGTARR